MNSDDIHCNKAKQNTALHSYLSSLLMYLLSGSASGRLGFTGAGRFGFGWGGRTGTLWRRRGSVDRVLSVLTTGTFFGGRGFVGGGPLCTMRREESSSGVALRRSLIEPVEAERPRFTGALPPSSSSSVLAER